MRIAVSFCNQPGGRAQPNIAIVDTATGERHFVEVERPNAGVTGLFHDPPHLYALATPPGHTGVVGLLVIDPDRAALVAEIDLPHVVHAHSLVVRGRSLHVVSTGTDEVLRFELTDGATAVGDPQVVWTPYRRTDRVRGAVAMARHIARTGPKRFRRLVHSVRTGSLWSTERVRRVVGTHHPNGLCTDGGHLYVSAFGTKRGELLSGATRGYVSRIGEAAPVLDSIHHPHSPQVHEGAVWFCESSTRSVRRNHDVVLRMPVGYTRGLAVHPSTLVVGSSSGRKVSKSTGVVANPADPGMVEPACAVTVFRGQGSTWTSEHHETFDDTHREIYDVVVLSDD